LGRKYQKIILIIAIMAELVVRQETVFAQAPFDHFDSADIIIRSSDGVYFRMVKLLLSLASPVFKDMFGLPRSADGIDETKDGLPVVDLTEDSGTIKNLLSFCYPVIYTGRMGFMDLSEVHSMLEAANKYEMEGIRKDVVQNLTKPEFLANEPLRVYAIACRHKLEAEALLAVKSTLIRPVLGDAYFPELVSMDARQLYSAMLYRKECAQAAMKVAKDHTWITSSYAFFDCGDQDECQSFTEILSPPSRKYKRGFVKLVSVYSWWMEYMESSRMALETSSSSQTVKNPSQVGDAFAAADKCGPAVVTDFREFVETFAAEIDKRIAEVQSPLLYL
jgi:hypothetical protein